MTVDPRARPLRRRDLAADPLEQFGAWFQDARDALVPMPEALSLATATPDGHPSARMVLLKSYEERGFVFFSSYESRKAVELAANPRAALCFYWHSLGRQVRIEGTVSRVDEAEADAYFRTRPYGSQLSASVSRQSEVVANRAELESAVERLGSVHAAASSSPTGIVGRIPARAGDLRVLAAPRRSTARSLPVPAGRRRLGGRAAGAMTTGDDLRALFRRAPAGVAVMTVDTAGERLGLTVSAFVSLSLSPPLVGVSISRQAAMHELAREAHGFALSLLAGGQEWLAQHFARGVPPIGMWHGIATTEGAVGAPLLAGALGWIECRVVDEHEVGDHTLFVGEVLSAPARPGCPSAPPPPVVVSHAVIEAVVFDLDGVILETEEVWDDVRGRYVVEQGGRYDEAAQRAMMGMSSLEWSRYLHESLGVPGSPRRSVPRSCAGWSEATASTCH